MKNALPIHALLAASLLGSLSSALSQEREPLWADLDGDGLDELVALTPGRPDVVLRNLGDGTFADATAELGLGECVSREVVLEDVDGDGRVEVLRVTDAGALRLHRTTSPGLFADVSADAGLAEVQDATSARWLDFDRDGHLDLYVETDGGAPRLFHGLGAMVLEPVKLELPEPVETAGVSAPGVPAVSEAGAPEANGESGRPGTRRAVLPPDLALPGRVPLVEPPVDIRDVELISGQPSCATSIEDLGAPGNCLSASSTPTLGMLYPLSSDFFIDPSSGFVGIGTVQPAASLDIVGDVYIGGELIAGNGVVVNGSGTAVGGGMDHAVHDDYCVVGGGAENTAGLDDGTIDGQFATISGGRQNTASALFASIGGGDLNTAAAAWASVGGGGGNLATENAATVAGGFLNLASGGTATVGGGNGNTASGIQSTVPGGSQNTAGGMFSLAAGRRAEAQHERSFVWSSTDNAFSSSNNEQFLVDAPGGVGLNTNEPLASVHIEGTDIGASLVHSSAATGLMVEDTDAVLTLASENAGVVGSVLSMADFFAGAFQDQWAMYRGTSSAGSNLTFSYGPNGNWFTNDTVLNLGSTGRVGIGTTSPVSQLQVASGDSPTNIYTTNPQPLGIAIYSASTSTEPNTAAVANWSQANGDSSVGVLGLTNAATGVFSYGTSAGVSGAVGHGGGDYQSGVTGLASDPLENDDGVTGTSFSDGTGAGVRGIHNSSFGDGPGVQGWSFSSSSFAAGVEGRLFNNTPGLAASGVNGIVTTGSTGQGVRGQHGGNGVGVLGLSMGSGDGVVGRSSLGRAIFADGELDAVIKSFVHPHPTDASKEIRFVCLEGNESGTYFRGSSRLVNGIAVIEVPEDFRLVTQTAGLTVQATALGEARVWVESKSLDEIIVRGGPDVAFDYFVNGIRQGLDGIETIRANRSFVPELRGVPYGEQYPAGLRRILVENGTLAADFTPNEAKAVELGWTLHEPLSAQPMPDRELLESTIVRSTAENHPEKN